MRGPGESAAGGLPATALGLSTDGRPEEHWEFPKIWGPKYDYVVYDIGRVI